ncbi:uncharacterized protein LOC122702715 [Cervus elaphus]|uniref:uncharacterized protein LOC122702715 n=1 Tax=Cervus elaphus TaxID=9860 RepID=UPI001CC286F8|nr:uncharacterized protein LOC122702715 [Cervus elaphus]
MGPGHRPSPAGIPASNPPARQTCSLGVGVGLTSPSPSFHLVTRPTLTPRALYASVGKLGEVQFLSGPASDRHLCQPPAGGGSAEGAPRPEEPQRWAGGCAAAAETAMKPSGLFWALDRNTSKRPHTVCPHPVQGSGQGLGLGKVWRGRFSLEDGRFRLRRSLDKCLFNESREGPGPSSPDLKVSTACPSPEMHIFPTKAQGGPLWGRKALQPWADAPFLPPTAPHQTLHTVLPHPLCLPPDAFSDHRYGNRGKERK